jgi:hypothetical protein
MASSIRDARELQLDKIRMGFPTTVHLRSFESFAHHFIAEAPMRHAGRRRAP